MNITSIAQYRLLRYVATVVICAIAFAISLEELRPEVWIILGMAIVMAGIISFMSELSDAKGSVLYIGIDKAEEFVDDMSVIGFHQIRSTGDNIYLRRGMDIIKLGYHGNHYQVEMPAVYELVAERYRSI